MMNDKPAPQVRDDLEACEWPAVGPEPPCIEPATGLMTYRTQAGDTKTKALCGQHFRQVEAILWSQGLTWTAEPMGLARKLVALQHRADAEDLGNRSIIPATKDER